MSTKKRAKKLTKIAKISNGDLVKTLMEKGPSITRMTECKHLSKEVEKVFEQWTCPTPNCGKVVDNLKGGGYSNPYKHLLNCCGNGSPEYLQRMYLEKKGATQETLEAFDMGRVKKKVEPKMQELHDWIKLIVEKFVATGSVEDEHFRNVCKCKNPTCSWSPYTFSRATVRDVILQVSKLVEKKVAEEMKEAERGAIMYDGWSKGGQHFLGMMACYLKDAHTLDVLASGKQYLKVPVITLISVAVMMHTAEGEEDAEEDADATEFTAEKQKEHMEYILSYFYDLNFKEWVKALIADNAPVNIAAANLLGIPHIGCMSHLLNLQISAMVEGSAALSEAIERVHQLMYQLKNSLKSAAALRHSTKLVPILYNKTRWSGKYHVLHRFLHLRELGALQALQDGEEGPRLEKAGVLDGDIMSAHFFNKVKGYAKMMEDLSCLTLELQKRCISISAAQGLVDALLEDILNDRLRRRGSLKNCMLQSQWIGRHAQETKRPNKHFRLGVMKIQENKTSTMAGEEKAACASLKLPDPEEPSDDSNSDEELNFSQRQEKKRKMDSKIVGDRYCNCDFIYGSSAEIERLWSFAKLTFRDNRMSTSPYMLECMLFLKFNDRFWDVSTVEEAFRIVSNERKKNTIEELQDAFEDLDNIMEGYN